jgi:hypothetical protein
MVKPWLVGVVEPVLGTECSWLPVRDLPEHGVLVGSSQVAAGLAELLVVEQPAAEPSIRDRLFIACMTFSLSSCQDIRSHRAEHNAVAVTHTMGAISHAPPVAVTAGPLAMELPLYLDAVEIAGNASPLERSDSCLREIPIAH